MLMDSAHNQTITESIVPLLRTTSITTGATAVDIAGAQGVTIAFQVGAVTDGTHTPSVYECATSAGSYTAVAADDLIGSLGVLVANTPQKVGYRGTKQYLKAYITTTGSPSTGACAGAIVILTNLIKQGGP